MEKGYCLSFNAFRLTIMQAGFVYKKDGRQTGDVRVSQLYVEVRYTQ